MPADAVVRVVLANGFVLWSRADDLLRERGRQATARSGGDGRSTATRSHAQRSEHGEDGEHRTFAAASTVAASPVNGAPITTKPHQ